MIKIGFPGRLRQIIFVGFLACIINPSYANLIVSGNEIEAWVDQYVVPSYAALHQSNLQLQTHTRDLCNSLSWKYLDDLQPHLSQALTALAYSQAIDGGPMQDQLRNFQLYFWPDRNNLVSKQLGQLMLQADLLVLQTQGLEQVSVALAGYPVLERLLFMPSYRKMVVEDQQKFACSYIIAVSDNLVRLTGDINKAWKTNWRSKLLSLNNTNSRFKKPADQVSFIFSNIDLLLTKIITKKLAKPVMSSAKKAKPKRLESWRSGNSLVMLKANTQALSDSLKLTLKPVLIRAGERPVWQQISHDLSLIKLQLDKLPLPLVVHLSEPHYWQLTKQLQDQFSQLQVSLRRIYPRLDVRLGFNAYDGD